MVEVEEAMVSPKVVFTPRAPRCLSIWELEAGTAPREMIKRPFSIRKQRLGQSEAQSDAATRVWADIVFLYRLPSGYCCCQVTSVYPASLCLSFLKLSSLAAEPSCLDKTITGRSHTSISRGEGLSGRAAGARFRVCFSHDKRPGRGS